MRQSSYLKSSRDGAILEVMIQPKASKNEIVGILDGALKIRIAAPPVEGAANKECVRVLSKTFGISKSKTVIIKGEKSRRKTILLRGLESNIAVRILEELGVNK